MDAQRKQLYNYLDVALIAKANEAPAKKLLRAVINLSVLDALGLVTYQGGQLKKQEARRFKTKAQAWLRSNKTSPMSFRWACEQLDICPKRIRNYLKSIDGGLDV